MYCFEDMIEDLERNLFTDIRIASLSQKANMSVYEFRRIFAFVAGIPISEYIRKRRLSLSATELYEGITGVARMAEKCGYDSVSSFSRAFKAFHGITPHEVRNGNHSFRLLTKINAAIVTKGGLDVSYSVFSLPAFTVSGFRAVSPLTDTECCEGVWEAFYRSPVAKAIADRGERIFAVYENGAESVICHIGAVGQEYADKVDIAESTWISFRRVGTDDQSVNEFYQDILLQWLASTGYEKNGDLPNIEVFPADMSGDGFTWEIRIPVRRRT